ncbi:MAG: hypothetical protein AAGI50_16945 [Pseudomonadota bacterium]
MRVTGPSEAGDSFGTKIGRWRRLSARNNAAATEITSEQAAVLDPPPLCERHGESDALPIQRHPNSGKPAKGSRPQPFLLRGLSHV